MSPQLVSVLAQIYSEVACVEGMKAENKDREQRGAAIAYTEKSFEERADALAYLAGCARNLDQ